MSGESTRKRVQAVLFAAIMVVSMVAAGVGGFAGSAAAEVTEISGLSADDTTAGDTEQVETVTLQGINKTGSNLSEIEVVISDDNVSVTNATVVESASFNQVEATVDGDRFFTVSIPDDATPSGDITVEVTLDTTDAKPGTTGTYTATPNANSDASVSDTFQIQSEDDGNQSDGVLTVDPDGTDAYDTIQAAIDNAESGDIINVTSGTYGSATVGTDNLTIIGSGNVTGAGSGDGFVVTANDTTVRDISITEFNSGVEITEDIRNLRLDGVTIDNSSNGLRVSTAASIEGLQVVDSTFSKNNNGVYFAHPQPDDGNVTDVLVRDTTFQNHTKKSGDDGKALYAETLSNATFDNVRVIDGEDGFDINLKAGDYGDITVKNSIFDDLDSEAIKFKEYDGTGGDVGGGPNYELGDVTVDNVTITDSYAAIWAYGYRQTDLDLTLRESNFTGNEYHLLIDPTAIGASDLSTLIEDESLNNEFDRAALVDSQPLVVYSGFERAFAENEVARNDTVTVYPGTYNESVTINTPNVTLESTAGPSETNITAPETGSKVVQVNAPNVTVDGFNIESSGTDNGLRVAADDAEVINNHFEAPPVGSFSERSGSDYGVWIDGATGTIVVRNQFTDGNGGIQVANGAENTTIVQNDIYSDVTGIGQSSGGDAVRTLVENNTISVGIQGISGWQVDQMLVRNNTISVNDTEYEDRSGFETERGVDISGDRVIVSENTISSTDTAVLVQNDVSADIVLNDLNGTESDIDATSAQTVSAPYNYYSGDVPSIEGAVIYDPVLTTSIEDVDASLPEDPEERIGDNISQYGSVLNLQSDGSDSLAIGFTAPSNEPISELLSDVEFDNGAQAYRYDIDSGFEPVNGDFTPDAGQVVVIATDSVIDEEIVVPVDVAETDTDSETEVDLNGGWNLVPTGATNDIGSLTVREGSILEADQLQAQPTQPGVPGAEYGAYEATWVFVERDFNGADVGLLTGYETGQTASEYVYEVLNPKPLELREPDDDQTFGEEENSV